MLLASISRSESESSFESGFGIRAADVDGGIARVPTVAEARPFDDGGAARPDVDGGIARVPTVAVARPFDTGGAARLAIQ